MSVTSKESSRCIWPWPAAFATHKNHSTVPNRPRMSNSRGTRQWRPRQWTRGRLVHSRRNVTRQTLFEIGDAILIEGASSSAFSIRIFVSATKWSSCYFCSRTDYPCLCYRFAYSSLPAPAWTPIESRRWRSLFFFFSASLSCRDLYVRVIRRVIDVVLRNDSRSWNSMLYSKSLNYDVLLWITRTQVFKNGKNTFVFALAFSWIQWI